MTSHPARFIDIRGRKCLNRGTRWGIRKEFHTVEQNGRYTLNRALDGANIKSGYFVKEKNLLSPVVQPGAWLLYQLSYPGNAARL